MSEVKMAADGAAQAALILPPNFKDIQARDAVYADALVAFAQQVEDTYGQEMRDADAERDAIAADALALEDRRRALADVYAGITKRRRAAGLQKFPAPPKVEE
jgi:hypothetical protein